MRKGFVAYSKADSSDVDRLMVHLKGLEYEGLIETWYDGHIVPGEEWDLKIRAELSAADVVIFCVSADLLATDYIQRVEIPKAIVRHECGEAIVIPVILRKCAWQGHALGRLQGIPAKDGTVRDYARNGDPDDIWTEVTSAVRDAIRARQDSLDHDRPTSPEREAPPETWIHPSGAKPVILSDTGRAYDLEQEDFIQSTFVEILRYFEASLENLKAANPGCEVRLRKLSEDAFETGIYMDGQRRSFCGVFIQNQMGWGAIGYSDSGVGNRSSMNESLNLVHGETGPRLKWRALMSSLHHVAEMDTDEMDPGEAASYLWSLFVRSL